MTIRRTDETDDLLEGLSLDAQFDSVAVIKFGLEWEPSCEVIRRLLIGNGSQVLHLIVRRKREVESNGVIVRNAIGEEEADVGDLFGVVKVDVVDSVGALEVGDQRHAGHD